MATQQTAKTEFVEAKGTRYAYRRLGQSSGIPLVLLQHFRGTMDHWDPAFINPLAQQRPLILLDNSGVGKSKGEIPLTFAVSADNVIAFASALDIKQIDVLGFSMGAMVAQMVALNAPSLVRKLIISGSSTSYHPGQVQGNTEDFMAIAKAQTLEDERISMEKSFYAKTEEGRAAARASWDRIHERQEDRSKMLGEEGTQRQIAAFTHWITPNEGNAYERLHELTIPVLVANGDSDPLIPTINSWILFDKLVNARLAIYPASGHGFIYQYASQFTSQIRDFLDDFSQRSIV